MTTHHRMTIDYHPSVNASRRVGRLGTGMVLLGVLGCAGALLYRIPVAEHRLVLSGKRPNVVRPLAVTMNASPSRRAVEADKPLIKDTPMTDITRMKPHIYLDRSGDLRKGYFYNVDL